MNRFNYSKYSFLPKFSIVYGSTLVDESRQEIYLYNTNTESEILLIKTPKYDSVQIEFSPDNTKIALLNVAYPHRQNIKNEGVFIYDLLNRSMKFINYPSDTQLPQAKVMGSELKWSIDGDFIYLAFNGHIEDKSIREYHKLDIKTMTYSKANGYYDENYHEYRFLKDGKEIEIYEEPCLQWKCLYNQMESIDGNYFAFITDDYQLIITDNNGDELHIGTGEYNDCEGRTINILSWLNDKYLIYQINEKTYVFGVNERKKALLFDSPFFWFGWYEGKE